MSGSQMLARSYVAIFEIRFLTNPLPFSPCAGRPGMERLIDPKLAAAWQGYFGETAPGFVMDRRARNLLG